MAHGQEQMGRVVMEATGGGPGGAGTSAWEDLQQQLILYRTPG